MLEGRLQPRKAPDGSFGAHPVDKPFHPVHQERKVRTWVFDPWVFGPQEFDDVYDYPMICRAASPVRVFCHTPSGCTGAAASASGPLASPPRRTPFATFAEAAATNPAAHNVDPDSKRPRPRPTGRIHGHRYWASRPRPAGRPVGGASGELRVTPTVRLPGPG